MLTIPGAVLYIGLYGGILGLRAALSLAMAPLLLLHVALVFALERSGCVKEDKKADKYFDFIPDRYAAKATFQIHDQLEGITALKRLAGNVVRTALALPMLPFLALLVFFPATNKWATEKFTMFTGFDDSKWVYYISRDDFVAAKRLPRYSEVQLYTTAGGRSTNAALFVSHKWYGHDPDSDDQCYDYVCNCLAEYPQFKYIWLDCACTNQKRLNFKEIIAAMIAIPEMNFLDVPHPQYNSSAWCRLEYSRANGEPLPADVRVRTEEKNLGAVFLLLSLFKDDPNLREFAANIDINDVKNQADASAPALAIGVKDGPKSCCRWFPCEP